jgi:predicted nucleic acid-binding protein
VTVVVPDASVILKWVLPGDELGSERALALRDAIRDEHVRAIVPGLWLYEVGNTVARRYPDHARAWLSALAKFGLEEAPATQSWLTKALDLTKAYAVSFYDAAYHATALVHGGVFVTADERYAKRTSASGAVVMLEDWTSPRPSNPRRRN